MDRRLLRRCQSRVPYPDTTLTVFTTGGTFCVADVDNHFFYRDLAPFTLVFAVKFALARLTIAVDVSRAVHEPLGAMPLAVKIKGKSNECHAWTLTRFTGVRHVVNVGGFREVDMTKTRWGAYLAGALAPALLAIAGPVAAANLNFVPTTAISLPSGTAAIASFDISFVDSTIGLYFLADRSNKTVDVVQTSNNHLQVLLTANPPFAGATGNNDTSGPDGVITVRHQEVWAGDAPSSIKVINLFNRQTTHAIPTGGVNRTDEMCVNPRSGGLVMAANNADDPPFVTFTSTTTYTVVKTTKFPEATGGIEQCQFDIRTNQFYISVPEVNGGDGFVYVFDVNGNLVNKFDIPLASCSHPQGLTIGPAPQILLGCNGTANANNPTAIISEIDGHVIATINNQSGSDEVWFNPGDGLYFLARSAAVGATQRLGIIDSVTFASNSVFTANKNIPGRNAHSVAADPSLNQVYVPIPAGVSTICGSLGGSDAQGCIAVFTAQ